MEVLEVLIYAVFVSLFCCGLHFVTRSGWVLDWIDYGFIELMGGRIRYTYEYKEEERRTIDWKHPFAEYIYKPLLGCIVCMGSIWGVLGGFLLLGVSLWLIPFAFIVAAMNGVIYFNLLKHWE